MLGGHFPVLSIVHNYTWSFQLFHTNWRHSPSHIPILFRSLWGKLSCLSKMYIESAMNPRDPSSTAKSLKVLPFFNSWFHVSLTCMHVVLPCLFRTELWVLWRQISKAGGNKRRIQYLVLLPLFRRGSPSDWGDRHYSPNHWNFPVGHVAYCRSCRFTLLSNVMAVMVTSWRKL